MSLLTGTAECRLSGVRFVRITTPHQGGETQHEQEAVDRRRGGRRGRQSGHGRSGRGGRARDGGGEARAGESVTIPGFGTFEVRERSARTGRNPQTGEAIDIAASRVPAFKAGKALRERVN